MCRIRLLSGGPRSACVHTFLTILSGSVALAHIALHAEIKAVVGLSHIKGNGYAFFITLEWFRPMPEIRWEADQQARFRGQGSALGAGGRLGCP